MFTVVVTVAGLIISSIVEIAQGRSHDYEPSPMFEFSTTILLSSIPTLAIIYSSVLTLFPVVREMKNPLQASSAVHIATGICTVTYLMAAGKLTSRKVIVMSTVWRRILWSDSATCIRFPYF